MLTFDFFPFLRSGTQNHFSIFVFVHMWILLSFSGASTDNLPPGVLYKVKASYKYQAEDVDELNFEVGEIMNVVSYEDPEEQVRA